MVTRTYVARVVPASGPTVIYSVIGYNKHDAERRLRGSNEVTRMAHPVQVSVKIVNHGIGSHRLWEVGT